MDNKKYLLGIKEIDRSHTRLINVIQKLEQCFAKGSPIPKRKSVGF